MPQPFRLYSLPPELVREILRLAATPTTDESSTGPHYDDAVSLARVSYTFRQLVMPHLLRSVTLKSDKSVNAFFRALNMQHQFQKNQNRLSFPYPRSIQRFWCSEFFEPLMNSIEHYDYRLLFDVFSQARQIGFHLNGIELLHETLASWTFNERMPPHFCKDLTIAGTDGIMRWNPLTAVSTGARFLEHITHLTILRPDADITFGRSSSSDDFRSLIPESARAIPFGFMRNLSHFAICLNAKEVDGFSILVIANPDDDLSGGEGIKRKLLGPDVSPDAGHQVVKVYQMTTEMNLPW
ncbi:hypothetical protein CVT24_006196 [Panaeolus cyanescens]|uniref:F-box domain-containing protein n=1 Tax=Panaeolus cyanescens TaxID=181874 RepID=A0A409V8P8_9AGAR|nr:hypothetical protein CVT24_006196 [Panaeolus cyanescens]